MRTWDAPELACLSLAGVIPSPFLAYPLMPRNHLPTSSLLRSLAVGCTLLVVATSSAAAQRGGGGMGRGGPPGGGGGGGGMESPIERVKDELKLTDELEFLEKRSKDLTLDKEQKEALKALSKEMEQLQKPILKDIEKSLQDAQKGQSGGGMPEGGEDPSGRPGGRGRGGMPTAAREGVVKLTDIQSAFADRAAVLLSASQKVVADSLRPIYKEDLREKAEKKARSRASGMGGGGMGGGRGGGRGGE